MKLQESERTEFKSIVVTDIKKEIIAFANCDGGKIYIGIEPLLAAMHGAFAGQWFVVSLLLFGSFGS